MDSEYVILERSPERIEVVREFLPHALIMEGDATHDQLTAEQQLATPANWEQGDDVIIAPAVSDEEARDRFPDGWEQPLPYIRIVRQP